jgi:hypothetical protein
MKKNPSQVGMLGKIFDELIDKSGDLFDVQ